ncbi:hypothetical protein [Gallibacterium sp. AGMB14963]|uniref:hypothetical protein n=1 Tax=Gallibacterium faecale TaxID=3019086 RepID=UPI0022F156C0|nr:hypothetical protein [Gallibacterium sp. AGMB14963]MDA3979204.1 hypothetical protein [Gallibacterium sp. AGMB14963]
MRLSLKPVWVALFGSTFISTLNAAELNLRVIETTDLHANMMDYDYYKDAPSSVIGLVRAADYESTALTD